MRLEAGKSYRTYSGCRVDIVSVNEAASDQHEKAIGWIIIHDDAVEMIGYALDGRYMESNRSGLDISKEMI